MRSKIIGRFAAGTFGVCFAYALIRQPFAVMKDPSAIRDWEETAPTVIIETTLPVTTIPPITVPETLPAEPSEREDTVNEESTLPTEREFIESQTAAPTETTNPSTADAADDDSDEDDPDKQDANEEDTDEEQTPKQESTGGDVPTLSQFLSQLTCGGCRHRCLLVNPRCMKGRAKAESATVEYYETYGA